MLKELLRDSKLLTSAGSVVIALALIWLIATKIDANTQALNGVSSALSANTAITSQFQLLLLEIKRNPESRSALMREFAFIATSTQ